MTNFVDKLRLAERAEEDIYFARIDRELIDALHQQEQLDRLSRLRKDQQKAKTDLATQQNSEGGNQQEADK
jgi:hypothetical protein